MGVRVLQLIEVEYPDVAAFDTDRRLWYLPENGVKRNGAKVYRTSTMVSPLRGDTLLCKTCRSDKITLEAKPAPPRNGGIPDGRLRMHDVHVVFYIACDECSATLEETDRLTDVHDWLMQYGNLKAVD